MTPGPLCQCYDRVPWQMELIEQQDDIGLMPVVGTDPISNLSTHR
jgi:hypothetical protein